MVQKDPNRNEWKMPLERRFLSAYQLTYQGWAQEQQTDSFLFTTFRFPIAFSLLTRLVVMEFLFYSRKKNKFYLFPFFLQRLFHVKFRTPGNLSDIAGQLHEVLPSCWFMHSSSTFSIF